MIDLTAALAEVVAPAVNDVFAAGEVSSVTLRVDPHLAGGSLTLSLVARGESFEDIVVQGDVPAQTAQGCRERLRSNLADFVSESRFGWGVDRGVSPYRPGRPTDG